MPRIRVRMSEWEIGFVDLACAYYGLSRGEYMEHLVRGIPCVPASEGAARDRTTRRKAVRRGTDEWSRRTQYVCLSLGARSTRWRRVSVKQERKRQVSFTVSEEALEIARRRASESGMSLEGWIRSLIFKGRSAQSRSASRETRSAS